jgi:hypothetical protein
MDRIGEDGWVKTPVINPPKGHPIKPDEPFAAYYPYPSGYVLHHHWRNSAATGKSMSEIKKK